LPFVHIDSERIEQALFNLLENSIRHTPAEGMISLQSSLTDHRLLLTVKDTGEGIPPEHLPHIFERFYRADHARNRQRGGSGLGLAIVQAIVKAHGGEINVESDGVPGNGSKFTIRLPR
jgi:signal transduction histidine kinase